jgi:hypothetical protein
MCRILLVALAITLAGCAPKADSFDFRTRAEKSEYQETTPHGELVTYLRRLEECSPWVRVVSLGRTGEGHDLQLVIASTDGAITPQDASRTGKAVVLIVNGVHSGEIEGKDASLALLRDIAITKTRQSLLDHVILLVIPIFNLDGHERASPFNRINQNGPREMGWRCTARNLNLNRDYMKADTPEMRAFLTMYRAWRPHLWFDTHTTDGADFQYDVMFGASGGPEAAPGVARYVNERLHPHLLDTLAQDGHVPQLYFEMRDRLDPAKGVDVNFGFAPRFSTGYGAITNRPSLLVETHMLKPFGTRVRATYDLLVRTLELVNRDPTALTNAVAVADADTAAASARSGEAGCVVLTTTQPADDAGQPIAFKGYAVSTLASAASGAVYPKWDRSKPVEVPSRMYVHSAVDRSVQLPTAYLVPPQWTEVIDRLELHGVATMRLEGGVTIEVESYRFVDATWREKPFEGRHQVSFRYEPIREVRNYPAGSVLVRMDHPSAKVAAHLLEPDAPDSLVRWGFFDPIFEQKEYFEDYALAPLADRMLESHPRLRTEFHLWLSEHPAAAKDPQARLNFFFERSPYGDRQKQIYPVGRVIRPIEGLPPIGPR